MTMKKSMAMFVLLMLILSPLTIAAENVTSEPSTDCGFFCKVSKFLWGSSEARAGAGWFDR